MKRPVALALAFLLALALAACTRGERTSRTAAPVSPPFEPTPVAVTGLVTATGILVDRGLSSYQYGTHVLLDPMGKTLYALRASALDLDDQADRPVRLVGIPVPGYPLAGGPPLLDVTEIGVASP